MKVPYPKPEDSLRSLPGDDQLHEILSLHRKQRSLRHHLLTVALLLSSSMLISLFAADFSLSERSDVWIDQETGLLSSVVYQEDGTRVFQQQDQSAQENLDQSLASRKYRSPVLEDDNGNYIYDYLWEPREYGPVLGRGRIVGSGFMAPLP